MKRKNILNQKKNSNIKTVQVTIRTSGSTTSKKGFWKATVVDPYGKKTIISESYDCGTHNELAVWGAIEILLKYDSGNIEFVSNNQYLISGINSWLGKWKNNNWRTCSGASIANKEHWQILDGLAFQRNISWRHQS